jgi:hypothetical protein
MAFTMKKSGGAVAKVASTVVKGGRGYAKPVAAHTSLLPPGKEPIGGRYRVWNHNLPPQKAVAVRRTRTAGAERWQRPSGKGRIVEC